MPRHRNGMNKINHARTYSQLIKINQKAIGSGQHDVAYHTLAAALHCAADVEDVKRLGEVERLADEQLKWIDAHHPEYEHSTQSASKRGHVSIFKNLATIAN